MAAIVALAVALVIGASACACMERGERGEGHHKMSSCAMCERMTPLCPMHRQMMYCPMCGQMMVCPQCREMMEHRGMGMGRSMGMGMGMGERGEGHPMMMRCPMCGPEMDKDECNEMMEHMGMPPHMRMHCMAMACAKMMPTDPAKLMAMQEHLKLTQEQMDKLAKVQKDAAAQAEGVLTPEQKGMIEKMKELPHSMMGMHEHMHKMMEDGMKGEPPPPMKGEMK